MIKNKNNKELVQLVYTLSAENQKLKECEKEHDKFIQVIRDSKILSFVFSLIPTTKNSELLQTYNLNNNHMIPKKDLIRAVKAINNYERKQMPFSEYAALIKQILNINVCLKCGSTHKRLHRDFQRRILNVIKDNKHDIFDNPVFISGKYASAHYQNVPYWPYADLTNLYNQMRKESVQAGRARRLEQAKLIQADMHILQQFIMYRLELFDVKPQEEEKQEEPQITVEQVEKIIDDAIKAEPIKEVIKEEPIAEEPIKEEPQEEVKKVGKKRVDSKQVMKLKKEGKTHKEIAEIVGCSVGTIGRIVKKNK